MKLNNLIVFMTMLLSLTGTGALTFVLLEQKLYHAVLAVSTVITSITFSISTWLYLRNNYEPPNVLEPKLSEMAEYKRKILVYVLLGVLLGVPAVYVIMHGVKKDIFTTVFPLSYIIIMSVVSMAFLPGFLKATGAIAPVRYMILTVTLFVMMLKVAVYLNSYFPGNLTDFVAINLFFALGCGNVFLLFLLLAAWHQVFTLEHVVVIPLNQSQENAKKLENDYCIVNVPAPANFPANAPVA